MRLLALTLIAGLVSGILNAQDYGTKVTASALTPVTSTAVYVTSGSAVISAWPTTSYTAPVEFACDVDVFHNLTSSATTPPVDPSASFLPGNTVMTYNLPAYAKAAFLAKSSSGKCHMTKMTNK